MLVLKEDRFVDGKSICTPHLSFQDTVEDDSETKLSLLDSKDGDQGGEGGVGKRSQTSPRSPAIRQPRPAPRRVSSTTQIVSN